MNIKLIEFGGKTPWRAHHNDAGADVFTKEYIVIPSRQIMRVPLGIGLELPDGMVAFVLPRSGMSAARGITTEVVPIDSGYRGEIHAIVFNSNDYDVHLEAGTKIAQLVIMPVVIADFTFSEEKLKREAAGFGSTGEK